MKLKPIIAVRLSILVCAILGYKAYQTGVEVQRNIYGAQQKIASVTQNLDASQRALSVFSSMEKHDAKAESVNVGVAKALLSLNASSIDNGVNVSSLTVAGGARAAGSLAAQATPVPLSGGSLMESKMTMRLNYTDFLGLQSFIYQLNDAHIRVSKLEINGNSTIIEAGYLSNGS